MGLLTASKNFLNLTVTATVPGEACGAYVEAYASRGFSKYAATRLPAGCISADCTQALAFDAALPSGTTVLVQQTATNHAGLASALTAEHLIVLDATQPYQAVVRGCTSGGREGSTDGVYYQTSEDSIMLCWPVPGSFGADVGFSDPESGVWYLEWQVAVYVASSSTWDTITSTEALSEGASLAALQMGTLRLDAATLTSAADGLAVPRHPRYYRIGLRAVNRAGLRSCVTHGGAPFPDGCEQTWGQYETAWAAEEGVQIHVDYGAPVCVDASAHLCDPDTTIDATTSCRDISLERTTSQAVGDASGGSQDSTDTLFVQIDGLYDPENDVDTCHIEVLQINSPGTTIEGASCACDSVLPYPQCDCARIDGEEAHCEMASYALKAYGSANAASWADTIADYLSSTSICVSSDVPFNVGSVPLNGYCNWDHECACKRAAQSCLHAHALSLCVASIGCPSTLCWRAQAHHCQTLCLPRT